MGKLKFIFLGLVTMGVIGHACRKEPVDPKLFVEKQLEGIWPLRLQIVTTLKNNKDTLSLDTIEFIPADTTLFTNELKFYRGTQIVDFSVDAMGENINFSTTPDSTWNIGYLRKTSFKLVYTRKETVGTDVINHIIERDFSR